MSFRRPNVSSQSAADAAANPSAPPSELLLPSKATQERVLKQKGGEFLDRSEADARNHVLKSLNALRTLVPALITASKSSEQEESQAYAFTQIMDQGAQWADYTFSNLLADESGGLQEKDREWVKHSLFRAFIPLAADRKARNVAPGSQDNDLAWLDALMQTASEAALERPQSVDGSLDVRWQAAWIKALLPWVVARERFNFLRPKDQEEADERQVKDWLNQSLQHAFEQTIKPLTSTEDRIVFAEAWLDEAGKLLATAWEMEAGIAAGVIKAKGMAKVKSLLPQGFPLDEVQKRFKVLYIRLLRLMKQGK